MRHRKTSKERKIDEAVDMTFPASDAPAHGASTGTEPPRRPANRQAPPITKEQIERAQRGEGHAHVRGSKGPRDTSDDSAA